MFNPLSAHDVYPSQPDALLVPMTDIYVLIIAAFHSADYFASRISYCFGEKRKNIVCNKNQAPVTNVIVLFFVFI